MTKFVNYCLLISAAFVAVLTLYLTIDGFAALFRTSRVIYGFQFAFMSWMTAALLFAFSFPVFAIMYKINNDI